MLNLSSASFDQALSDHAVVFVCFYAPVRDHLGDDRILSCLKNCVRPVVQALQEPVARIREGGLHAGGAARREGHRRVGQNRRNCREPTNNRASPQCSVANHPPPPVPQEQGPTARAGIVGYPTLVLFHHSLEVEHYTGGRTSRLLVQYVEGYCSKHL